MVSLLEDLPRGDPDRMPKNRDPKQFRAPEALFAKPSMLLDPQMRWERGKFFLGVIDGTMRRDAKGRRYVEGGTPIGIRDDRHICTLAGSRGGKGRAAIVNNALHWPGSMLINDSKGELAMMTARRRQELGQDIYVIDPFGITKNGYPGQANLLRGFNPIANMTNPDSFVEDAALIADAMVIQSQDKDPHWEESARAFIEGLVLHVRTWARYKPERTGRPRSLLTLQDALRAAGGGTETDDKGNPIEPAYDLETEMKKNGVARGIVKAAAIEFFERPSRERGSVLSNARRQLKFIDLFRATQLGAATMESHDLGLDCLKKNPNGATIYMCLPARHMTLCNRWIRLFVNLTLQRMERLGAGSMPGGAPLLCLLDEFASLGRLQQISDAAAQIAGYGVKLWFILQDLGQLQDLYKDRWETFLGNAGLIQCFANADLTTLGWISHRCGKTSFEAVDTKALAVPTGGELVRTEVHDLLSAEEVARFFGRDDPLLRQLVIWSGPHNQFLVLQRAFYDKHELFKQDGLLLADPVFNE